MGDRAKRLSVGVLVAAAMLGTQACWFRGAAPSPPPTRLRPTIVGVAQDKQVTATAYVYTLADGRTVRQPFDDKDLILQGGFQPGRLLLARDDVPRFINLVPPTPSTYPGCWDAWNEQGQFVWDEGNTLVFAAGIELPKSPTFHDDARSTDVNGQRVWALNDNPGGLVCVNSSGQIEWIHDPFRNLDSGH